jgi:hypothetical protein
MLVFERPACCGCLMQSEAAQRAAMVGPLDGNPKVLFAQMSVTVADQLVHEENAVSVCVYVCVHCWSFYVRLAANHAVVRTQVFKKHSVTSPEVEDAYRYYSVSGDMEVIEATAPIKTQAGKFLLSKDACISLAVVRACLSVWTWIFLVCYVAVCMQSAAELQAERAQSVVDEVCSQIELSPQNAQMVYSVILQQYGFLNLSLLCVSLSVGVRVV